MRQHFSQRRNRRHIQAGMTLLELIIACGILMVLSSAALPLARVTVKRQREAELRRDLREMRDAIDRYKDAADKNLIRTEVGSQGYPPDLDTLMTGVTVSVGGTSQVGTSASTVANFSSTAQVGAASSPTTSTSSTPTKVRFLRKIPVDPMSNSTEWGLRSMQDDPDSDSWGGQSVFDVYTKSLGSGLDGTKYKDW